jgi:hypothetical protein
MEKSGVLLTVGHGNLDRRSLGGLLTGAGIHVLVEVRRFPGSRTNPDVRLYVWRSCARRVCGGAATGGWSPTSW